MAGDDVSFYLPELDDVPTFEAVDPDDDWHLLGAGRFQTVGQTYLRLRRAGYAVRLVTEPPRHGTVVVFAPNLRRLLAGCPDRYALTVVCVEADRPVRELPLADVLVRHNRYRVDGRRIVHVPNWPQGGLVPRDAGRGTRVGTVAYKGRVENLHPELRTAGWEDQLRRRGLRWAIDGEGELGRDHRYRAGAMAWNDYHDVDVVVAVRPGIGDPHVRKPAVKLVNAWTAGVPAVLGPEQAYRELRQGPLDYLEVDGAAGALRALDRLASDPDRYAAMVAHGRARAAAFSVPAITTRWEELLFDRLPRRRPAAPAVATRRLLAPATRVVRRARRELDTRRFAAAVPVPRPNERTEVAP